MVSETTVGRRYLKLMSTARYHMSCRPLLRGCSDQAFQSIISPYVITARYDRRTIAQFHEVFLQPTLDAATAYLYRKVLSQKARLSVEIEYNSLKSERLLKVIRGTFSN